MNDWVVQLIDAGGYWGIGLLMVLENLIPPIPSELIMGIGGIRVGQGRMEIVPLLIAGTIGSTIGNYAWYLLGRALGFHRLEPLVRRHGRWLTLHWREVEWLDRQFQRHGAIIVFVFRFLPAFRTIVSLPAGLFRMGTVRFLAWTCAGALIWNVMLVGAGYLLGTRIAAIDTYLGPATNLTLAAIALGYGWRFARWKREEAD